MIKIEQTTNYGKFKTIRGNREINRAHLSKLCKAIEANNMLEANPIMVNERMQILNGQHRLAAAEKLGLPIFYVTVPTGGISEVQMLNSNSRSWTMINYLNSYVLRGNEHYIQLKDFMDSTGLTLGLSLLLFSGAAAKSRNGKSTIQEFKDGDMKSNFKEFAFEVFKKILELAPYSLDNSWKDREFVAALIVAYRSGMTQESLINKLDRSGIKIPRLATRRQYIKFLEDVLSFKSRVPVRLI